MIIDPKSNTPSFAKLSIKRETQLKPESFGPARRFSLHVRRHWRFE